MSQAIVLQVNKSVLEKMNNHYSPFKKEQAPPYTLFAAKKGTVTITAYKSGKVLFQGPSAEKEAGNWQASSSTPTAHSTDLKKKTTLPPNFSNWSVIGSDEVGNGSYFGPVTVCAAFVPREKIHPLKKLGVKDSKLLTDSQIRLLAPKIEALIDLRLLTVTPSKYNQIQPKYNVNHMKAVLHNQAIYLLLQQIAPTQPEGILIDQFTPEKNYRRYIKTEVHPVTDNLYFTTKGEHYHIAVAAASIICRAAFLDSLEALSLEAEFPLPSGAGSKSDAIAAKILKKGGLELLGKYAKLHFANTEKAHKLNR
ncbi:ribonuclease HIII [Vagococcus entomophilus]|uniref:Ribonuclease HIII n=1 Tax=Vagococcus entomophilus TaxID=1160095 RepID=A0A430AGM2_9ENTE|nr:ribonuclease HIII [Vagococcus entomophilus]RSU07004.1 ribonuclease HIII [Vagococcus entomophilus]